MEVVYIVIGIVIGVVGAIFLDVDMFSKKAADEEKKVDDPESDAKIQKVDFINVLKELVNLCCCFFKYRISQKIMSPRRLLLGT